jgi:hypothetical protein
MCKCAVIAMAVFLGVALFHEIVDAWRRWRWQRVGGGPWPKSPGRHHQR